MRSSEPRSHRPHRGVMVTFRASIEPGPVEAALPGWRARPAGAAGADAYPRRHGGLRFGLSFALGSTGAGSEEQSGAARTVRGIWDGGRVCPRGGESGLSGSGAFCGLRPRRVVEPGPCGDRPASGPTAAPIVDDPQLWTPRWCRALSSIAGSDQRWLAGEDLAVSFSFPAIAGGCAVLRRG